MPPSRLMAEGVTVGRILMILLSAEARRQGISDRSVSIGIGLDPTTFGKYVREERSLSLAVFMAASIFLGIDPVNLLRRAQAHVREGQQ